MSFNVLSRSFSTIVQNQKAHWLGGAGSRHGLNSDTPAARQVRPSARKDNPGASRARPELRVEDIKVTADEKYMYCKGCVRSQGTGYRSNVVVAVEWLDKDHQALNTDWKRIEINLAGNAAPCLPNAMQPFIVQATLDRRVKWVKAYAFSGTQ
jgi:hypothetical protein